MCLLLPGIVWHNWRGGTAQQSALVAQGKQLGLLACYLYGVASGLLCMNATRVLLGME